MPGIQLRISTFTLSTSKHVGSGEKNQTYKSIINEYSACLQLESDVGLVVSTVVSKPRGALVWSHLPPIFFIMSTQNVSFVAGHLEKEMNEKINALMVKTAYGENTTMQISVCGAFSENFDFKNTERCPWSFLSALPKEKYVPGFELWTLYFAVVANQTLESDIIPLSWTLSCHARPTEYLPMGKLAHLTPPMLNHLKNISKLSLIYLLSTP